MGKDSLLIYNCYLVHLGRAMDIHDGSIPAPPIFFPVAAWTCYKQIIHKQDIPTEWSSYLVIKRFQKLDLLRLTSEILLQHFILMSFVIYSDEKAHHFVFCQKEE